jgi:hypothetical protein
VAVAVVLQQVITLTLTAVAELALAVLKLQQVLQ